MRLIGQSIELFPVDGEKMLWNIESACRNCYKSEGTNAEHDHEKRDHLIQMAVDRGHTSVLEHGFVTFRVICNRGVSHEWVRHRIGWSYSQESTRYCNYGKEKFGNEITVIWPSWAFGAFDAPPETLSADIRLQRTIWLNSIRHAETSYLDLLKAGAKPDLSRDLLQNALKTEIVCTANIVALRHFFNKRCEKAAHAQIRELALQLLAKLSVAIPVVFDDLYDRFLRV